MPLSVHKSLKTLDVWVVSKPDMEKGGETRVQAKGEFQPDHPQNYYTHQRIVHFIKCKPLGP